MRPAIVVNPRALRSTMRDLDQARDTIASARESVTTPAGGYPWHNLVDAGVDVLLHDTQEIITACRRISSGLEDSLNDFEGLDHYVALSASIDKVDPTGGPATGLAPAGPTSGEPTAFDPSVAGPR